MIIARMFPCSHCCFQGQLCKLPLLRAIFNRIQSIIGDYYVRGIQPTEHVVTFLRFQTDRFTKTGSGRNVIAAEALEWWRAQSRRMTECIVLCGWLVVLLSVFSDSLRRQAIQARQPNCPPRLRPWHVPTPSYITIRDYKPPADLNREWSPRFYTDVCDCDGEQVQSARLGHGWHRWPTHPRRRRVRHPGGVSPRPFCLPVPTTPCHILT